MTFATLRRYQFFSFFMTHLLHEPSVILLILCAGLIFIAYINRFKLKRLLQNWRTQRCLGQLGLDQINNLSCPDGLDGYFTIDRIILLDHAILIINYKKYPGKIFGSENIDEWTQMLGQKSYKFSNPLFNLNIQLQALSKCIPEIPVEARLFFDSNAEFPKSVPPKVIHPNYIEDRFFCNNRHKVKPEILLAWKKLESMQSRTNK